MLTVGSLFSGIGGFDLGLERAGMRVLWQSEIDPYASAVLRKHWPDVPNLGDIRTIATAPRVDLICGGFPCQPFSSAGNGLGKSDDRYLWPEMLRVIQECRPAWVIGENVVNLDRLALEDCIAGLEASGYEVAPPLEIPACAVDADHKRSRIWILGYSHANSQSRRAEHAEAPGLPPIQADAERRRGPLGRDASGIGREWESVSGNTTGDAEDTARGVGANDGLSGRMDRLACLGNSIHPDIAEIIGRAIMNQAEA